METSPEAAALGAQLTAAEHAAKTELQELQLPIRSVIAQAIEVQLAKNIGTQISIAPPRDVSTTVPPVLQNSVDTEGEVLAARAHAYELAEHYGYIDTLSATKGEFFTTPLLAEGAVICAAIVSKNPKLIASVGSIGVFGNTIRTYLRDRTTWTQPLKEHLSGLARVEELENPSSLIGQSRVGLAARYGTDWLTDFENWGGTKDMLTLSNVSAVSKAVRERLNHFLMLTSERPDDGFAQPTLYSVHTAGRPQRSESTIDFNATRAATQRRRYEIETECIKDEMENLGFEYSEADERGIRCFSHLRSGEVTDDVKGVLKWLRTHPRIETKDNVRAESLSLLKRQFKQVSEQIRWEI